MARPPRPVVYGSAAGAVGLIGAILNIGAVRIVGGVRIIVALRIIVGASALRTYRGIAPVAGRICAAVGLRRQRRVRRVIGLPVYARRAGWWRRQRVHGAVILRAVILSVCGPA